ncbi:MAG: pyridoxamine 5'-phosphate oxidase family protein [Caulobacteraceae bacterium]
MGKVYERLDGRLTTFIRRQKVFFVATAPLAADGCVNLSPKGYDSLAIIDERTVAWLDLGGSGIETLAHVKENGRITLMFCAFEGAAGILRIHGRGEAIGMDEPGFAELLTLFPGFRRARSIVKIRITRIADSCGWGVPFYEFKGERDQLKRYGDNIADDEWPGKFYAGNGKSIDGLPGFVRPEKLPVS